MQSRLEMDADLEGVQTHEETVATLLLLIPFLVIAKRSYAHIILVHGSQCCYQEIVVLQELLQVRVSVEFGKN